MKVSSQNFHRLVIASALVSGLVSTGIAASAQTVNAAGATTQVTAASAATTQTIAAPAMGKNTDAMNVSLLSVNSIFKRQADFEQANADEHRRMLFRNQGTSL
jgi:hypothetical protein